MPTQIITTEAPSAQGPPNGHHRTGPDTPEVQNGTDVPIPLAVSVRFERKTTLCRMLDYQTDRWQRCERMGDVAGAERADRYLKIIDDELERRDAIAAEKERRRQARMRLAAVIFRETGQVRA